MSTYDTWKSTDPRDGEPDWNNEREQELDGEHAEHTLLCTDCENGNHEQLGGRYICDCPCHGGQQ